MYLVAMSGAARRWVEEVPGLVGVLSLHVAIHFRRPYGYGLQRLRVDTVFRARKVCVVSRVRSVELDSHV